MSRDINTSAIVDGILKLAIVGGALTTTLVVPNAIQAFDKPLKHYLNKLDARARERELRRITSYMKKQGLIKGDYKHGLTITPAGIKRAKKADFAKLAITKPVKRDKKWRLVLFDIPEQHKRARDALTYKLKLLGFKQLQQSVWVHPFPCRQAIEVVCLNFDVSQYVTYIETNHIDKQQKLIDRFTNLL